MALFGRRKPGFSKEVELRAQDIPGEFSDLNDPARQDLNPKSEKKEMADYAQAVMDGTAVPAEQKVDIFDYMDTLPEQDDPFPPSENPIIEDPQEIEKGYQPGELLAEYIRERCRMAQITPLKALMEEDETISETIVEMRSLESCADIVTVQGQKDEYFYSNECMANNYAMIAMLVYEKNLPHTVAHMVRFNCKTYPAPTPLYHFMRSPYSYTKTQLEQVLRVFKSDPAYADIGTLTTWNNVLYMYSERHMDLRYAKALAEYAETDEGDV